MKKWLVCALAAISMAVLLPTVSPAAPAGAQAAEEASFLEALNQTRARSGLPALVVHDELTALSREWARTMADAGEIFHADPISAGLGAPWLKLGENVGVGPTVRDLMQAFEASPGHYANIIDPGFTHVGVGVVWVGNRMFTTHRFMKMGAAPADPPAPVETAPPPPAPEPATTVPAAPVPPALAFTDPAPEPPSVDQARVGLVLRTLHDIDD
jgi:hypothetical protein